MRLLQGSVLVSCLRAVEAQAVRGKVSVTGEGLSEVEMKAGTRDPPFHCSQCLWGF